MIEVVGDEGVIRDFARASALAAVKARHEVQQAAEKVTEYAQDNAPKNRPQLAPSITFDMVGPLEAEIGPENALGGGYGHIIEKGLAGRPPQPFLGPALDRAAGQVVRDFEKMAGGLL